MDFTFDKRYVPKHSKRLRTASEAYSLYCREGVFSETRRLPDVEGQARTCSSKPVMSRSAIRVRSAALFYLRFCEKNVG